MTELRIEPYRPEHYSKMAVRSELEGDAPNPETLVGETLFEDDVPIMAGGCREGVLWLVTTDRCSEIPTTVFRVLRTFLDTILFVRGRVMAKGSVPRSGRLLEKLGFSKDPMLGLYVRER